MTEMVKRVARALVEAKQNPFCFSTITNKVPPRTLARLAIAAMREPTEAMLTNAMGSFGGAGGKLMATAIWQAMIDTALK